MPILVVSSCARFNSCSSMRRLQVASSLCYLITSSYVYSIVLPCCKLCNFFATSFARLASIQGPCDRSLISASILSFFVRTNAINDFLSCSMSKDCYSNCNFKDECDFRRSRLSVSFKANKPSIAPFSSSHLDAACSSYLSNYAFKLSLAYSNSAFAF